MPSLVVVSGGDSIHNLREVKTVNISATDTLVTLLQDCTEVTFIIQVGRMERFSDCSPNILVCLCCHSSHIFAFLNTPRTKFSILTPIRIKAIRDLQKLKLHHALSDASSNLYITSTCKTFKCIGPINSIFHT